MSQIAHLATVGSTNDWLAERPELPDESWVRADAQTGGRGRRGRAWTTLPGNLFASVLVRPRVQEGPAQQLSFVAAVALADALDAWVAPERLTLKWPNDVLLDGTKCAGILLEGQAGATIVGFGVNLAAHPADSERPASSLAAAGIAPPLPTVFVEQLADTFAAARRQWHGQGFAATRRRWLARAAGIGGPLVARLGSEEVAGIFDGLDEDGALRLRLPGGGCRAIHAGEVFAGV